MDIKRGQRVLAVLPVSNTWIVCVDGWAGWHVERACLLLVTLHRGQGSHRFVWCTYLTLDSSGIGDPIEATELDGMIGVYEAPSKDAAILRAIDALKSDVDLSRSAQAMRTAQVEAERARLAKHKAATEPGAGAP